MKNADINKDIVTWGYATHQPKHFDVLWASPPCTEDNRAKPIGVWNMSSANEIVTITLEISEYLDPTYFILEHPQMVLVKKHYV